MTKRESYIKTLNCTCILFLVWLSASVTNAQPAPGKEAFTVLKKKLPEGPRITSLLQHQTALAWKQDDVRKKTWEGIDNEKDLLELQADIRKKFLRMIGGLPETKTPLNARITGTLQGDGFRIEKLLYESLPKVHVSALVYVPENGEKEHPAVLVPCGHAPSGKIHYQELCQRLVKRGYLVICWDPIGQGERSQFWDKNKNTSRYNLVCGEHAILGNLAYLAGTNLARWEIIDGIRALDYLFTRDDVDRNRISITGTSGGGLQTTYLAAVDLRIKVAAPSCYITALPMRAYTRIFADPDSDPEQDLAGMIAEGVDHPGLLLMIYPRPLFIASAVQDFFPIEGTKMTYREIAALYERSGYRNRIAIAEGYHPHRFSNENQEAAIAFLDRFNNLPYMENLPETTLVKAEDLKCTKTGQVLLDFPDDKNLTDVIRDYLTDLGKTNATSIPSHYYGENYPGIKQWVIAPYPYRPVYDTIGWEKKGDYRSGDIVIEQYLLHHSGHFRIPVLFFRPAKRLAKKTILWLNLYGKAGPEHWEQMASLIHKGNNVISFDLRGTGEDCMVYEATSSDRLKFDNANPTQAYFNPLSSVFANYVYNSILTGRPYFLQMLEDIEIVIRFSKEHLKIVDISVAAADSDAILLTRKVAETFPGISVSPIPHSGIRWSSLVNEKKEIWPIHYVFPGGAYIE